MRQSKKSSSGRLRAEQARTRVALVRDEMERQGLDGFFVPHEDEQHCEYTPPYARRLEFVTMFDGSAGLAVVLPDDAALFVDGRYTRQAAMQTDRHLFELLHVRKNPPIQWIGSHIRIGQIIGYDPWLVSFAEREEFAAAIKKAGGVFVPCCDNPIDRVWKDQPDRPCTPIMPHPLFYAGKSAGEKLADLARQLRAAKVQAIVLTAADSIAWLLNIRGSDVAHTPLPLVFAIVTNRGKVQLFCGTWP